MNDPVMVDLVSERSLVPDSVVHEVCVHVLVYKLYMWGEYYSYGQGFYDIQILCTRYVWCTNCICGVQGGKGCESMWFIGGNLLEIRAVLRELRHGTAQNRSFPMSLTTNSTQSYFESERYRAFCY